MQNTPSTLRAFANLPRSLQLWLAYDSGFIALWLGRKSGLFSDALISTAGIPIFAGWVLAVTRWIANGSPTPTPRPRD